MLILLPKPAISQQILMDTTIYEDTEFTGIFGGINVVTGINFSGDILLNSDSSLVRILFTDQYNDEFMIHESYPLIVEDTAYAIEITCDETCFMDSLVPTSIKVDIIDAVVDISHFTVDTVYQPDLSQLQYDFKRKYDSLKIIQLNNNIVELGMEWEAGDNSFVEKYYLEKKDIFGGKYNLGGYDYYVGGIFELAWKGPSHYHSSNLVDNFDWRSRHGATHPNSPYYDNDELGIGWVTKVKNQGYCGVCGVFSTVGLAETYANLQFNQHIDFDLSEQSIVCHYPGGCQGIHVINSFNYMMSYGITTEFCFPYADTDEDPYCDFWEDACLDNNPDTLVYIDFYNTIPGNSLPENIQTTLIENGLLNIEYLLSGQTYHSVALTGYIVDPEDQSLIWIYKDSYGPEQGNNGFKYTKNLNLTPNRPIYYITGDLTVNCEVPPEVMCNDWDNDGYCNWGIEDIKPEDCPCENDEPDCDDNNPAVGPFDENYFCTCMLTYQSNPEYISTSKIWYEGTDYLIDHDIIITKDGSLTIRGVVYFASGAKMVVETGGELYIDGGLLTRGCDLYWEGIEVRGNPSLSQFNPNDQGYVSVINNGRIEYAKVGISASEKVNGVYTLGSEGGIVQAIGSSFTNNIIDIEFFPYQNMHPYIPGHEVNNFSFINKCNFITSYGDCYDYELPDMQIYLESVKGIKISGCRFEFVDPIYQGLINADNYGTGIYFINASVIIDNYCDDPVPPPYGDCNNLIPTMFKNLRYGIQAFNNGEPRLFDVCEIQFINNSAGIYMSGFDQASILSNEIVVKYNKTITDGGFWGGMYIEDATGYHIENNTLSSGFNGQISQTTETYGIYVKNSGAADNELYRNAVHNFEYAIIAEGVNRGEDNTGLYIKCNNCDDNLNDIFAIEDPLNANPEIHIGIKKLQGANMSGHEAKASNLFTRYYSQGYWQGDYIYLWNYINTGEDIYYYHHQRQYDPLTYPGDNNYHNQETIVRDEDEDLEFNEALACPSKIINNGTRFKSGTDPRQIMDSAQVQIDDYRSQLESLVDGGDTDDLNWDVLMSMPDEGLDTKQQLMDESPYLSDTVMLQAIYKEDVLPNAMVRDVLTANPQSAKSDKILEALDDRIVQMPEYMMGEIMQGLDQIGAKESLESKLAFWQQEREFYKNVVIRLYISDTTLIAPIDSLITFYLQEDDLSSQYRLAFCYLNNDQVEDAVDIISSLSGNFELSNHQAAVNDDYQEYFEIIQIMYDSNLIAAQLDSVCIDMLFDIMDNGYPLIGGYARNLLINAGQLDYTETCHLPVLDQTQSYIINDPETEAEQKKCYLKVFPNPAWDYVIIEFNTEAFDSQGIIMISDIAGRIIQSRVVPSGHNQVIIEVGNLSKGVYNLTLFINGNVVDTEKVSINR